MKIIGQNDNELIVTITKNELCDALGLSFYRDSDRIKPGTIFNLAEIKKGMDKFLAVKDKMEFLSGELRATANILDLLKGIVE